MIRVSDLQKSFGSFQALKGIDLHVEANEVYGFLGHNGAGKSTTINILAGLLRMDSGSCRIDGVKQDRNNNQIRQSVGYLPEDPRFYPWMTATEYLAYIGSAYQGNVSMRIEEVLDWVGLAVARNRRIGGFSRGMKQRLGMAVALFYDPQVLLLDEPSSALDPQGRADVLEMIRQLRESGKTVFLSTHILDDVERVCTKVGILSAGSMVAEMALPELMSRYRFPLFDFEFTETPGHPDLIALHDCPEIYTVNHSGSKVSVRLADPAAGNRIFELASVLKTPLLSVSQRQQTLEEIFISITGGVESDATGTEKRVS